MARRNDKHGTRDRGDTTPAGAPVSRPRAARLAPGTLPTSDQILEYLASAPEATGKREITRAFGIMAAIASASSGCWPR